MTKKQLEDLKKWFFGYVATFYNTDALTNENIKLKEDHTRRMCDDTLIITETLGFNNEQKLLAETISLLHETGRFKQYKRYKTYNDVGTENHGLLGLQIIAEKKILDGLDSKEKEIIETAIRLHGEKDLPKELAGDKKLFSQLIRDIDKLDIYNVMINRLDDFRKYPEKAKTTLGFSEKDKYSQTIIDAVMKNQTVSYEYIKTLNDMVIAILGWTFDINFVATLKEIQKRKLFDKLASFLPDNDDIRKLITHIRQHVKKRTAANQ